jgi:4-hydroxybenzoate polyprenyltransferase
VSTLKEYSALLRFHHYIKNILVFFPLFFGLELFNIHTITISVLGFVIFSILSSIVYVFNDIQDVERDRLHPVKCLRPLAAGKILVYHAWITLGILVGVGLIFSTILLCFLKNQCTTWNAVGLLALYLISNIGYSCGLKNIPILDITILAAGYVIRVLFGAVITSIPISVWLYLTITMGAYYLGLGKRRNEISTWGGGGGG